MSDANRTGLRYIQEVTWDTLPGTPTMQALRLTGEDLNANLDTIVSEELRSDRMISDLIQTSRVNGGGFNFELSFASFDTLLQGALFSAWNTNVLKNGTTEYSYSIERAHLDIDEYFLFKGMMVNSLQLTLATSSIATGRFEFLGGAATLGQSTNANSVTAVNSNQVMTCMANVAELQEGATLTAMTGVYVQELSFNLNNNLRPVNAIGFDTPQEIAVGSQEITGTMNMYFTSDRIYDKFLAGTASAIYFQIQDAASNWYKFHFPNVKFETDAIAAPGRNQDVIENVTWRALYSSAHSAQVVITRSA